MEYVGPAANESAEDLVRAWLKDPLAIAETESIDEICAQSPSFAELLAVDEFRIEAMFSAGERVAFRVVGHGRYAGGFADTDRSLVGRGIVLSVAGLVTVQAGQVSEVQIAFDRLGLSRLLLER